VIIINPFATSKPGSAENLQIITCLLALPHKFTALQFQLYSSETNGYQSTRHIVNSSHLTTRLLTSRFMNKVLSSDQRSDCTV